jgi:hypothetical protein
MITSPQPRGIPIYREFEGIQIIPQGRPRGIGKNRASSPQPSPSVDREGA